MNEIINLADIRHGIRVAKYSLMICNGLSSLNINKQKLYAACIFHDIGKAFLDQNILNKESSLSSEEKKHIQNHSIYTYCELVNMGYSETVAKWALYHHENFDGSGYPNGLKGYEIPLESRIIKIADVFDALNSDRPYRNKLSINETITIMQKEITTFDYDLFNIFVQVIKNNVDVPIVDYMNITEVNNY